MKLTAKIKLMSTPKQYAAILETLELSNVLCNQISDIAWTHKEFSRFGLQTLVYQQARAETNLAAQLIIRCIAKVADAYKKDKSTKRVFKKHGAIAFDDRILKIRNEKQFVSIWTVAGRQQIQFVCGEHQAKLLQCQSGESDLVYSRKHDCFYHAAGRALHPQLRSNLGGGECQKLIIILNHCVFLLYKLPLICQKGIYPHHGREYFLILQ